jgi:hypothetical protein
VREREGMEREVGEVRKEVAMEREKYLNLVREKEEET